MRVFGIDVNPWTVKVAAEHCCDYAWERKTPGLTEQVFGLTHGLGMDGVIIAAASSSLDPINFAGEISRKRGRVVVLGAVPTGFDREPHYYKKELEVRMSCSYGPGRYDPSYEEKGIDYPPAYVRWTENRNMQAFQELIASGKIDIGYLSTHVFKLEDAPKAYDLIVEKKEPYLGILIQYDPQITQISQIEKKVQIKNPTSDLPPPTSVSLAFIGAGSYAQGNLLPNIPKDDPEITCQGVMTNSGTTSKRVAEKFGFEFCTSDEKDIFENDKVNTVFIATRHDSHADYVLKALKAGKHVFVEKPLCLTTDEIDEIVKVHSDLRPPTSDLHLLMVGYNRRFAPLAVEMKKRLGTGPVAMIYRVNAGAIPPDTWIQDKDLGGGRIIGEACHFVDFLTFMAGSLPTHVYASALPDSHGLNDTVNINLSFANGSIGTVSYFANGSRSLPKEYIEVHQAGISGILSDFKELRVYGTGKPFRKKLFSQDKGQMEMVRTFLDGVKNGGVSPIPFEELVRVSRMTFAVHASLRERQAFSIQQA